MSDEKKRTAADMTPKDYLEQFGFEDSPGDHEWDYVMHANAIQVPGGPCIVVQARCDAHFGSGASPHWIADFVVQSGSLTNFAVLEVAVRGVDLSQLDHAKFMRMLSYLGAAHSICELAQIAGI